MRAHRESHIGAVCAAHAACWRARSGLESANARETAVRAQNRPGYRGSPQNGSLHR